MHQPIVFAALAVSSSATVWAVLSPAREAWAGVLQAFGVGG